MDMYRAYGTLYTLSSVMPSGQYKYRTSPFLVLPLGRTPKIEEDEVTC